MLKLNDSPLHLAARNEDLPVLRDLLADDKIQVDVRDALGRTPLYIYLESTCGGEAADVDTVMLFCKRGADVLAEDRDGRFPYKIALTKKMKDLLYQHIKPEYFPLSQELRLKLLSARPFFSDDGFDSHHTKQEQALHEARREAFFSNSPLTRRPSEPNELGTSFAVALHVLKSPENSPEKRFISKLLIGKPLGPETLFGHFSPIKSELEKELDSSRSTPSPVSN
jgi:hypothetical protein